LIRHVLFYAILFIVLFALLDIPLQYLLLAAVVHWLIDTLKWLLERARAINETTIYVIDQALMRSA
jgi:hypothetical protein